MTKKVDAKKIFWIYLFAFILAAFSFRADAQEKTAETAKAETKEVKAEKAAAEKEEKADKKKKDKKETAKSDKKGKEMFALFETNKGNFKVKLFSEKAPKTVDNFVGLADGTKEWTDPKSGSKVKKPFYDGLVFHRVIPNFMIQGGCPLGQGTGGPGYKFEDEFPAGAPKHDKPGILSMANAGPGTNGSQFFVTVAATRWLDGRETVFGEVVEGMDIVYDISKSPTASMDRPVEPIVIKHIKIQK